MRVARELRPLILLASAASALACGGDADADAFGTFEADEVVVSSQASGQLLAFSPAEGEALPAGLVVGTVDTTQLALERAQIVAQSQASDSRVIESDRQIGVLQVQREVAQRNYERTRRLYEQRAATAQQLDAAEREYRVFDAQIAAAQALRQSAVRQATSGGARVAQIADLITRSRIVNPVRGTVLATMVRAGELVQTGQPLYRIANLDTLTLRAYVTAGQLASIRLGQRVQVNVDRGDGGLEPVPGTITWIASQAEFTPTPIQTRDERADLVYAVKIRVPNPRGTLKIGMPADVTIPRADAAAS
jgi:HlyD family secretion protein